jgi:hypothetical protein
MRGFLAVALPMMLLAAALPAWTQTGSGVDSGQDSAQKARAIVDAMVHALGGQAWLNMKNQMRQENLAAFFHGQPSGGTNGQWEYHVWPDHDRIEYGKHRDVVQFFMGREGWEVTFKGKAPLPQEQLDDFLRRRDHSIETVIKLWLNDPKTILVYEGQRLAERHLADQITLVSAQDDTVTLQIDAETHLPLSRTFQWRDPIFKDQNVDAEEYDDYHNIDGFPTAFIITRFKNGEMTRQYFLVHATYNQDLPPDFWSVDAADRRIKK